MRLSDLLKGVEVIKTSADPSAYIRQVTCDTRNIEKDCAFVAISGYKSDGHHFISDALLLGALAVIVENEPADKTVPFIVVKNSRRAYALMCANFYQNPSRNFKLIGVTGTNGKTSTTYILRSILTEAGMKVGLIGTNQNMIGDEVAEASRTTPDPGELQALFHRMYEEKVDCVVMEVSSHALALNRVDGCQFDVGIFTNLTQDHLDFHGNMEHYAEAKSRLFEICTVGIINIDDERYEEVIKNSASKNFTYSTQKDEADFVAKNIKFKNNGVDFEVVSQDAISRINFHIPGKFSIYNALAAISAARVLGIDNDTIKRGAERITGVKGRLEIVPTDTDYTIIIDYAHTPDALYNLLSSVRAFAEKRIILLFGCGGDRDREKRSLMGHIASELADYIIVTSDNPRTEEPIKIIDEILEGMADTKSEYAVIPQRKKAIEHALGEALKGDIVLLAGKGHETYQIIGEETISFDEREIVKDFLKNQNP